MKTTYSLVITLLFLMYSYDVVAETASSQLPMNFILKTCHQVVNTSSSEERYFNPVSPEGTLAIELGNRRKQNLYDDAKAIASMRSTILEPPKHGTLIPHTEAGDSKRSIMFEPTKYGAPIPYPEKKSDRIYYMYESDGEYVGKDKAVFIMEFEGLRYKLVIDFLVNVRVDEKEDPCPRSKLIKVTK
jgi:hypothetical protein